MADVTLKQGDSLIVSRTLYDGSGNRVDLTGIQWLVFTMREILGSGLPGERIVDRAEAEVLQDDEDPDTFGDVQYEGEDVDSELAGGFWGEFEVKYATGEIQSFPNGGNITIAIIPQLDAEESS